MNKGSYWTIEEKATQIKQSAARAAKLSSDAVSAMKAGDFHLSRTLLKDAVETGRKCQVLIKEKKNLSKSPEQRSIDRTRGKRGGCRNAIGDRLRLPVHARYYPRLEALRWHCYHV